MINDLYRNIAVGESFEKNVREWLLAQARPYMRWLLAHDDHGVIWGLIEQDGALKLSSDVFSEEDRYPSLAVSLKAKSLQQVRLFGEGGELLVWKGQSGFEARLIEDTLGVAKECLIDENYILWGRGRGKGDVIGFRAPFTFLQEGQQGLRHAPPAAMPSKGRLALAVRHYLDFDDEGQAYVALSRLRDLIPWEGKKE